MYEILAAVKEIAIINDVHSTAARLIAEEYFDSALLRFIEDACQKLRS